MVPFKVGKNKNKIFTRTIVTHLHVSGKPSKTVIPVVTRMNFNRSVERFDDWWNIWEKLSNIYYLRMTVLMSRHQLSKNHSTYKGTGKPFRIYPLGLFLDVHIQREQQPEKFPSSKVRKHSSNDLLLVLLFWWRTLLKIVRWRECVTLRSNNILIAVVVEGKSILVFGTITLQQ